ncbi:hypothetical protein KAI58_00040 [Candidatus Gracilibacteria bacterium]|nr:hypothetical protein [Candidatus Gracilibacteria bacterium]
MKKIQGLSPAKINLTLDVFRKKTGENFHPLKTIFHKISLVDKVEIVENSTFVIEGKFSCKMEENLIHKAFSLVQKNYSTAKSVKVKIKKNIPEKSGLGGGSSNFATFIQLYFQLFDMGQIPNSIIEASKSFGKDIPFFFGKTSCSLGNSFGEDINPLNFNFSKTPIFIYQPTFKNATAQMYQTLQNLGTHFTQDFLQNPSLEKCGNGFDQFLKEEKYKMILKKLTLKNFHLCGSGSCFFSLKKHDVSHCKIFEVNCL